MSRQPNLQAREKILTAAHGLMFKHGFHGVSMESVAEIAGIKKANLFHYYPTKESLGLAMFDHAIARRQQSVDAMLVDDLSDPLQAVERLFDDASETMAKSGCAGGCLIGNIAQELSDCNEALRKRVAAHMQHWTQQWAQYLEKKKKAEYFRADLDPRTAAIGLLSLFEGAMIFCKANRSTVALDNAKSLARRHFESFRS